MYRASSISSLDVLPASDTHFSNTANQYSQSGWHRPNANQAVYGLEGINLYGTHNSKEPEPAYRAIPHSRPEESCNRLAQRRLEGLYTPPSDNMSTSFQVQQQHGSNGRRDSLFRDHYSSSYSTEHVSSQNDPGILGDGGDVHYAQTHSRPSDPAPLSSHRSDIAEFLQIPLEINNSRGSLPEFATSVRNDLPVEFAAQMTCLFWFETTTTLQKAENYQKGAPFPVNPASIVQEAIPTAAFSKWAATMLSITQVSKSVTLLALLFIYRLKTLCPKVKGKFGSEYRLLTVALMLGNKFLDDNTYTNKTWADVSGISVAEIHMMEVEFLGNMRYSLLATEKQWNAWQIKLSNFSSFTDAFKRSFVAPTGIPSLPPPPPSAGQLPSPSLTQASPPRTNMLQPILQAYNHSQWQAPYTSSMGSSLPPMPDLYPALESNRKRSYDAGDGEPPAKRQQSDHPGSRHIGPQLPMPRANLGHPAHAVSSAHIGPSQNLPLLPPLGFPTPPVYTPSHHSNGSITPTVQLTHHMYPGSQNDTPSRRTSPHTLNDIMSLNSSPVSGSFPHGHAIHSPSIYLQHRSSPYKPVRPPHTLLHPPPSGALQSFSGGHEQMHYQPLGRRNDYRNGVLPDYGHHQYLPQQQRWPALPQPNFSHH